MLQVVRDERPLDEPGDDALHDDGDGRIAGERVGQAEEAYRPLLCVLSRVHG